jgi:hypothetical protein
MNTCTEVDLYDDDDDDDDDDTTAKTSRGRTRAHRMAWSLKERLGLDTTPLRGTSTGDYIFMVYFELACETSGGDAVADVLSGERLPSAPLLQGELTIIALLLLLCGCCGAAAATAGLAVWVCRKAVATTPLPKV